MGSLVEEANAFVRRQHRQVADAQGRVALQLLAGIDLDEELAGTPASRIRLRRRLLRLLERERLLGHARHWSYDLNRHIALKQAITTLFPEGIRRTPSKHCRNTRRRCPVRVRPER